MREQFLEERVEYFRELQRLLYLVALNQETATKPQLVKALCTADPNLGDKQAGHQIDMSTCGLRLRSTCWHD